MIQKTNKRGICAWKDSLQAELSVTYPGARLKVCPSSTKQLMLSVVTYIKIQTCQGTVQPLKTWTTTLTLHESQGDPCLNMKLSDSDATLKIAFQINGCGNFSQNLQL